MKINKLAALALSAAICMSFSTAVSAEFYCDEDGQGHYRKTDGTLATGLYYTPTDKSPYVEMKSMCKYDSKGVFLYNFEGFLSSSSGRRYYYRGERLTGWQKIDGKYYHFNKDGIADTGKKRIAGCTYYFDENGVYTGRHTKKGSYPEDFKLCVSFFDTGCSYSYQYSSHDSKLVIDSPFDELDRTITYKLPNTEKQIIWSMIHENGFVDLDDRVYYGGSYMEKSIKKHFPDKDVTVKKSNEIIDLYISIDAGGKHYSASGDNYIEQVVGFDDQAAAFYQTANFLNRALPVNNRSVLGSSPFMMDFLWE